jgi:hypothetical protein
MNSSGHSSAPKDGAAEQGARKGPRRGVRAAKGVLIGLAGFTLILLVFALFFSAPLVQRYGLPAASTALSASGFSLKAAWVSGRPMTGVTFGDFRIVHKGAGGDSVTVFQADTLTVRYDIRRLLRKQWRIESVYLASPKITLIRPPEGGVLLPGLVGGGKKARRGSGPTVEIREIVLSDALLTISKRDGEEIFKDMDISCSYLRDPWSTKIGLARASFEMPGRSLDVTYTSADLSLKQGVLHMDGGVVKLPSSDISFDGSISFEDEVRYAIDCTGHPYDVPELAAILNQRWPEGLVEGAAGVSGPADSLAISAMLSGTVERFGLKDIDVECLRRDTGFSFSKIEGVVNGARIDATGRVGGALNFDINFAGLDASEGFFPDVSFPPTDLTGVADVSHRGRGPWKIVAAMSSGEVADFEFGSLFFRGDVVPGVVTADSIHVARPELSAEAAGTIGVGPGGEMSLGFHASLESVEYAADWLGAGELHGSLDATGTLSGPSADPVLAAAGPLRWVGRGPARLDGGTFDATVHGLGGQAPIDFSVSGGEVSLDSVRVGTLALRGTYENGELRVPRFSIERGDSSAAGSFSLRGSSGHVHTDFDSLSLALDGIRWRAEPPFTFAYDEGVYSLQGLRFYSGGGALALSGRLDDRQKQIEMNVAATGMEVSSFRLGGGEIKGGTASGQMSLKGPLSRPNGEASLKWVGARALNTDLNEITLRCDIDGAGISVERLWIDSSAGSCLITGRAGIAVDLARILAGRWRSLAEAAETAPLELTASVSSLDLGWLGETASVGGELSGTVSVTGSVYGSLERPTLDLDLRVDELSAGGVSTDLITGAFEYEDGRLRLSGVKASRGNVTALVDGYLPVSIGSRDGIALLNKDPMAFDVDVTPGDFGVAAEVWDGLARSSGTFAVDATVTGTPSAPVFSGSGWAEKCAFRLVGMEEEYRDVRCKYTLRGDKIEVTEVSGREGKDGSFKGSGVVTLAWPGVVDYNFDFTFQQMAVLTPVDFDAIVSGEAAVTAYSLGGGKLIPQIAGRVVVDEASYVGEVGGPVELSESAAAVGTVTPSWLADMEIEIPGTATVSNPDASLLLAGDILLIKDFDGVKPRGELTVVSGDYYLVNTDFNVTSGTITFGEAVGINPDLDITAETVLPNAQTGIDETIYVHLTGTASEPTIRVSSTSGYSETDIYNMLLAETLWGQGPQEAGGPDISALATNTLFSAIDARLRDLFGSRPPVTIDLTRRQYTSQGTGDVETRISVGRNLSRRLFVRYEQGFSAITSREVNLDYRVNRYLLLRSQIINNPDRGIREASGSEINFDLKLRYEF